MAEEAVIGFDMYSTAYFQGWSPGIIGEFERIISDFYKKPKVVSLLKFYEDLFTHIYDSPDAHDLQISPWWDTLMSQLYLKYRELGYTGSRKDLLDKIIKDFPVATLKDIQEGYKDTVAITADGWYKYFQEHLNDPNCHSNLRKIFQEEYYPLTSPSLYFSTLFAKRFNPDKYINYPFDQWKDTEGTIGYTFGYDFRKDVRPHIFDLFKIEANEFMIECVAQYDGTSECKIYTYLHMDGERTCLQSSSFPMGVYNTFKGCITYGDRKIVVRDPLYTKEAPFLSVASDVKLSIFQPITQYKTGFREWVYYPSYSDEYQRLYFVN